MWREIISTITNSVQSSFEIVVADTQGSELGREVEITMDQKQNKLSIMKALKL